MANTDDPKAFYGYLFEADKRPTKVMNSLLVALGTYIAKNIGDTSVKKLTPNKLAAFYKAVGGNYDAVFLALPHPQISFIFSSIGCQHTLQPGPNDFAPPSIPALTLKGFVHWQSIETLLSPEEHVPYLQRAVREWEIIDFETGKRFPELPADALPKEADKEIVRWHEQCRERLRQDCTPQPTPGSGPQSPRPRSQTDPAPKHSTSASAGSKDEARYYGYAHVKPVPNATFSATSSPRMRPADARQREDYFNSRPLPRRQKTNLNPNSAANSRPGTSDRLNPDEIDPDRGRRRSVPRNYYATPHSGEYPTPGSGRSTSHPPHSPRDDREHDPFVSASAYARRQPRHPNPKRSCSSGSEAGSSDRSTSPEIRPRKSKVERVREREMGMGRTYSGTKIPEVRYSAASPGSPRLRPVSGEGRGGIIGGVQGVASRVKEKLHRNLSGPSHLKPVPGPGTPGVRTYRVVDVDGVAESLGYEKRDRKGLRHTLSSETRHSTDTSGGSRSGSRPRDRDRGEGVRWHDLTDGVPLSAAAAARRHSDSPPHLRDSREFDRGERDRRREEREKYRREDLASGRKASSEEERKRRKEMLRKEEAYVRERDREYDRERERERERERIRVGERERRGTFYRAGVETRR